MAGLMGEAHLVHQMDVSVPIDQLPKVSVLEMSVLPPSLQSVELPPLPD